MRPHVRLLLGLLGVAIAGALGAVVWFKAFDSGQGGQPVRAAVVPAAAVGGPLVPTAGTVDPPGATSASPPTRLAIPLLGVDAVVESVGVDPQGRMAVPSRAENVGWYHLGPSPGEAGDAVIDGHLDWSTGPAVFWYLGRLKIGDEISVTKADGHRAQFVVNGVSTVPYDSRPPGLFATSGPPSLSLITCSGPWDRQKQTYLTRLVVHASLAPPKATQTPGDGG